MARTARNDQRRQKRSYTLSPAAIALLEELRTERKAGSASSVLDSILRTILRGRQKTKIQRAVASYYSSLSHEECREQSDWGDFALKQFPEEAA